MIEGLQGIAAFQEESRSERTNADPFYHGERPDTDTWRGATNPCSANS
jgi:hypothetical protein